jgi:ATP-dependent Clp protease ATP-binding subunit ClpA
MYERFTDRARKVMQLANQEAQRFNHEYIGTEHILLGLIKEGAGVAAHVLKNLDINLHKVRLEVEKIIQLGPEMVRMGRLPQTPRAKRVIEFSIEEARNLNHDYIGTEHILLGLLREEEGVAAQVLMNLGLKLEDVRQAALTLLGTGTLPQSNPKWPRKAGLLIYRHREIWVLTWAIVGSIAGSLVGEASGESNGVATGALLGTAILGALASFLLVPQKDAGR